jgi:hypothetical protein
VTSLNDDSWNTYKQLGCDAIVCSSVTSMDEPTPTEKIVSYRTRNNLIDVTMW